MLLLSIWYMWVSVVLRASLFFMRPIQSALEDLLVDPDSMHYLINLNYLIF